MRHSHESLSHLQFQDAVAQGLQRIDDWIRDAQLAAAELPAAEGRAAEIAEPMHPEIGGDKPIDLETAGDVLMF